MIAETPEPGGKGSLLDNTLILWTNELGKGNSHTLDNIPFVLVGNGLDFRMGRSLKYPRLPHNRLLLSLAHGMGHRIERFGNPNFCGDGPRPKLTGGRSGLFILLREGEAPAEPALIRRRVFAPTDRRAGRNERGAPRALKTGLKAGSAGASPSRRTASTACPSLLLRTVSGPS